MARKTPLDEAGRQRGDEDRRPRKRQSEPAENQDPPEHRFTDWAAI